VAVISVGGENRRKSLTCRKSLANFTKYTYILKVNPQTLFAYHIDGDWMIYHKHPIRSPLTSMFRKASILYPSEVYTLSFEKYKVK
jgi:hypothetical protein